MAKDFVDDFYCRICGSTTAVKIDNSRYIRCMGCLTLYKKGDDWVASPHTTIHPNKNELREQVQMFYGKGSMKKGTRVKWTDGVGYEHTGVVARDTDSYDYMIPVEQKDGSIIRIAYKELRELSV